LSAKEKLAVSIALFSIVTWIYPAPMTAHAQTLAQNISSIIFEVKTNTTGSAAVAAPENKNSQLQKEQENTAKKVALLKEYLESKNAPLADYADVLIAQPDWKTIIAISHAESNMGKHCYFNNCSGIYERYDKGYAGLKKYPTKADWIVDLQQLLANRYDGWTLEDMNGTYVYPKSSNWIKATTTIYDELTNLEDQFPENQSQNS